MANLAYLAMFNIRGMNDFGTKRGSNSLVSQAYPQNWNVRFLYQSGVESKIGFLGRSARAGREYHCIQ